MLVRCSILNFQVRNNIEGHAPFYKNDFYGIHMWYVKAYTWKSLDAW